MKKRQRGKGRKTTALDRAVLRYQKRKTKSLFDRIYYETYPVICGIAKSFEYLFPGITKEDLIQDAYVHLTLKVVPVYDSNVAGFKTLVRIAVTNKFRGMLRQIRRRQESPMIPVITFTEYELRNPGKILQIEDGEAFLDRILVDDYLRLFKKKLSKESWAIYHRLYRDPNSNFKKMAKEMGTSMAALYRRCNAIYIFLKILVEEGED